MDLQIYQKLGFKLFFCNENKEAMVEWKDPKNHLTIEEAQKYQEEGGLIGAWIPKEVKVLDLDRHEGKPDGFAEFKRLAEQYNFPKDILKKTFCVKTAGNGLHMYFLDSEIRKKNVAPGIEDRGSNLYVIAAGSPGYVPVNGVLDLIEFPPEMKKWLADAENPPKNKSEGAKTFKLLPLELLKEVLAKIDVLNFADNERWFQFMASCVAVAGATDDVFDLLEQWSRGDPEYQQDTTIRKRIESLKEDKGISVGTFIMFLKEEEIPAKLLKKAKNALGQIVDPETALALTDIGNGYAFIEDHGEYVRFCTKFDDGRGAGWLYYDGNRWVRDQAQIIPGLAKKTIKRLYDLAFETKDGALSKHALRSASNGRIQAMLAQARSVEGIPIKPDDLDKDPWLLNVENGTIDLRTGELRPPLKEDMLTKICNVSFDPTAQCPRWRLFINEIMDGDKDMALFLQKLMGYSITGDMSEDMYFFLWGKGCNGKTVFAETIITILGDYACTAMEETFMMKQPGKINADLARISDKRLIFTSELNKGAKLDESLIKRWSGRDTVTVEQKFQVPFDTKPIGKLIFRTNSKPQIVGQDEGIWRRTKLVPFEVSFEGREDRQLGEKLLAEASGILNWLLEGCRLWQKDGLELPPQVKEASAEYRIEQDSLNDFFAAYLEKGDFTYTITVERCYALYKEYAENSDEKVLTKKAFGTKMIDYPGIRQGREGGTGKRLWLGIRERTDQDYLRTQKIMEQM